MKKHKIILPSNDGHCGDTFRELAKLWYENNLVDLEIKNVNNCWLNGENDILLYDKPTLEWFHPIRDKYNFALFGNTVPRYENSSSWIFWGRRPSLMEKFKLEKKSFSERTIESLFLGKVENNIQLGKRTSLDWSNSVDIFEMPIRNKYKYTQEEYLRLLTKTKYGLCLSGYGPKCNREIELMCMGVVPIITPLVDLTYYNKLIENKHYIRVTNPDEIENKINSISKDIWEEMSKNCIEWYEDNCSVNGSFNTTIKILEKNNIL
jgi:hypothetical protein